MTSPVKHITTALKTHAGSSGVDAVALDDMASRTLADFFGALFEINQRLEAQSSLLKDSLDENK